MKKLKINNLPEVLDAIKDSKYSFTRSPSPNPTWLIIHEETKKVIFEYGSDIYTDYGLVTIDFFAEEEEKVEEVVEEEILKVDANVFIEVMCTCPHCNSYEDVFDNDYIKESMEDDHRAKECDVEVECKSCGRVFVVENIHF